MTRLNMVIAYHRIPDYAAIGGSSIRITKWREIKDFVR
jgi:hypothetical protein